MVDRLCVQVQDEINALTVNNSETLKEELDQASKVIKDADNSKQVDTMHFRLSDSLREILLGQFFFLLFKKKLILGNIFSKLLQHFTWEYSWPIF